MRNVRPCLVLLFVLALYGCDGIPVSVVPTQTPVPVSSPTDTPAPVLNSNIPDYIKTVAAYKEGSDGIVVYFILADANGEVTTADGMAWVYFTDESSGHRRDIHEVKAKVTKSDFRLTKVGQGAFERDAILYSFGRIKYSDFLVYPKGRFGKVIVEFQVLNHPPIRGEESISY
jgi:hypothetical protein